GGGPCPGCRCSGARGWGPRPPRRRGEPGRGGAGGARRGGTRTRGPRWRRPPAERSYGCGARRRSSLDEPPWRLARARPSPHWSHPLSWQTWAWGGPTENEGSSGPGPVYWVTSTVWGNAWPTGDWLQSTVGRNEWS